MAGSKDFSNMSRGKRGSSPKSGHRGKQMEERRVKNAVLLEKTSSIEPVSIVH